MASSVASTASPAPSPSEGKVLKGRDLINIGIFTAIYFVIQFVFMLCGGIHPALWVFHDSFVSQIAEQGMGADYLASLDALSTTPMLIAMFAVTIVAGLAGAYIARCLFKKHFEKAGLV